MYYRPPVFSIQSNLLDSLYRPLDWLYFRLHLRRQPKSATPYLHYTKSHYRSTYSTVSPPRSPMSRQPIPSRYHPHPRATKYCSPVNPSHHHRLRSISTPHHYTPPTLFEFLEAPNPRSISPSIQLHLCGHWYSITPMLFPVTHQPPRIANSTRYKRVEMMLNHCLQSPTRPSILLHHIYLSYKSGYCYWDHIRTPTTLRRSILVRRIHPAPLRFAGWRNWTPPTTQHAPVGPYNTISTRISRPSPD